MKGSPAAVEEMPVSLELAPNPSSLDQFEELVRSRRAVRHFVADPIPEGVLERLLDASRWAPSGFNLQPTHWVVVDDPDLKDRLASACFNQPQIREAPATVVFVGDRDVAANHLEDVLSMELEARSIDARYAGIARRLVDQSFNTGPLGLGWLARAVLDPLRRFRRPVAEAPAVQRRFWLVKQVMLAVMNFMLAARAAGLDTCPMEGFDEVRVRRILGIPNRYLVALVVPVGTSADPPRPKTRLPLERTLHRNGWSAPRREASSR